MKRYLCAGAKNETVGAVEIAEYDVCLDRCMLGVLRLARHFHNFVRFAESLIHVSNVNVDISHDVADRIVDSC